MNQWLLSVAILVIFTGLIESLPASRGMKELMRLSCGLFLILLTLHFVKGFSIKNFFQSQSIPVFSSETITQETEALLREQISTAIAEKLRNRAKDLGIDCTIEAVVDEDLCLSQIILKSGTDSSAFCEEIKNTYGVEVVRLNGAT